MEDLWKTYRGSYGCRLSLLVQGEIYINTTCRKDRSIPKTDPLISDPQDESKGFVFANLWSKFKFYKHALILFYVKVFLGFSTQSHAASCRYYAKKTFLNPKHATFEKESEFGHVHVQTLVHSFQEG